MCGIAGAIGHIDQSVIDAVTRMSAAQVHRGPDGEGFWTNVDITRGGGTGAAFAFRRLAIIDLSADGNQPMIDPASGNVIVFNGEIYNFLELRRELESAGVRFRSKSDTEILLSTYGKWGIDGLAKLRGMFAFAIWDQAQCRVLLVRDRIGIKPLYLHERKREGRRTVFFASELRSLLAGGLVDRALDPVGLSSYLWHGFVVGPHTIVRDVRLMPAGSYAVVAECGEAEQACTYWCLPTSQPSVGAIQELREALHTAVRQHLISDVPLGVFLSGGVDSSAISALAVQESLGDVRSFTISFDEAQFDESPHAHAVAKALGTRHTDVRLSQDAFRRELPHALASLDQPTFDGINSYFVSRAVREAGITVALAGTGGDELFGGYRSFVDIPKAASICRKTRLLPDAMLRGLGSALARAKHRRPGEVPPQTRWGKLADVLRTRGDVLGLYQTSYALFTRDFLGQLLSRAPDDGVDFGLPTRRARELQSLVRDQPMLHAVSMLELASFTGERLLRDTDAASMAVSLEARVPLLDHVVVEKAAAVPPDERFRPLGTKRLLRQLAMSQLDPSMFNRPKSGFGLPLDLWCREQLKGELTAVVADERLCRAVGVNSSAATRLWRAFQSGAPGMYWSRVWAIFVLLWWCRRYQVTLDGSDRP